MALSSILVVVIAPVAIFAEDTASSTNLAFVIIKSDKSDPIADLAPKLLLATFACTVPSVPLLLIAAACTYTGKSYLKYVPSTGIVIVFLTLLPVITPASR